MAKNIPFGPWGNPELEETFYTALVTSVCHIQHGENNGSMVTLAFQLEESGLAFTSRLYMPQKFSSRCQHRLWYLCQSLGLEVYELLKDPDVAVGRKLVLDVTTVDPSEANHGHAYSDVKRFLPYGFCDQGQESVMKKTVV